MNGMIKLHFGNCIIKDKEISSKKLLFCGSEIWAINKTDEEEMKEAQVSSFRQMFGLKIIDGPGSSKS
jgi:hypothetical protein